MVDEEDCNTRLSLGLGVVQYTTVAVRQKRLKDNKPACLDLTFTLCPKEEKASATSAVVDFDEDHDKLVIGSSLKKRGEEEEEEEEDDGNKTWESNGYNRSRKKLRLTKEQLNLLEDSLNLHTTLNSSQKQLLAEQLNLKPRQVEVWFQNRRARMKLKQTEVDCEFLKKCCESLTDENKRLKKELQELKSLKAATEASPLFIQLQKATNYCPSCKKL